ncbi:MAG TPA: transposase, partial [Hyphomicrobiaceae bacterium]
MLVALDPSELGEHEGAILAPSSPPAKPGGRPRGVNPRAIPSGVSHVLRSGRQWRPLHRDYGLWSTVYAYFRRWRLAGVWERIHTTVRERGRRGRQPAPGAPSSRVQSVEAAGRG